MQAFIHKFNVTVNGERPRSPALPVRPSDVLVNGKPLEYPGTYDIHLTLCRNVQAVAHYN